MVSNPLNLVVRQLRKQCATECGDRLLLERFVAERDEAAFESLLARHGPMVLDVCRRVLRDASAVEDAFQATFLVLVRKAGAIRQGELLANWLYGVAYRTASRAKVEAARRRARESTAPLRQAADPLDEMTVRELFAVLDEELHTLPAAYRAPLVMCYLENRTRDEAARQSACSLATIDRRLERGRAMLRARLVRRGLALGVPLLPTLFAQASGGVPASLAMATTKIATSGVAAAVVSPQVIALTEGVLKAMFVTRIKVAALVLALLAVVGGGIWDATSTRDVNAAESRRPAKFAAEAGSPTTLMLPERQKKEEPPQEDKTPQPKVLVVSSEVDGKIIQVGVKVGDKVRTTDFLARLDTFRAECELKEVQANLKAAEAEFLAAAATQKEVSNQREKLKQLFQQGALSKKALEEAELGQLIDEQRRTEETRAKKRQMEIAQIRVDRVQLSLEAHVIRSPVNGRVVGVLKQKGEVIKKWEPLLKIEPDPELKKEPAPKAKPKKERKPAADSGFIRWRTDYNQARKEAESEDLPMCLWFCDPDFPPCMKMENAISADKQTRTLMAECVPIRILSKDRLCRVLKIEAFPTTIVARSNGEIVATIRANVTDLMNYDWRLKAALTKATSSQP